MMEYILWLLFFKTEINVILEISKQHSGRVKCVNKIKKYNNLRIIYRRTEKSIKK